MTSPTLEPVSERILANIVTTLKTITTANVAEPLYFYTVAHVDRVHDPAPKEFPFLWVEDLGDTIVEDRSTTYSIPESTLRFAVHFQVAERDANTSTASGRASVRKMQHDIAKALLSTETVRLRGGNARDTKITGYQPVLSDAASPILGGIVFGECRYAHPFNDPTTSV